MKRSTVILGLSLVFVASTVHADILLNGDLDRTYQQEIVPGFFNPKPADGWINTGTRSISGPYEDEMSSEPWAGPAPTPVTTHGFNVTTNTANNQDWGVFFHPFSGNATSGAATGHLYQDRPGLPGRLYTMTGWAGAEANALMTDAQFALEFYNGASYLGGSTISLLPTLFVANGQPFNYKKYSITTFAPATTTTVRVRASMLGATSNPAGGGQAFVVDDFSLIISRIDHTSAVVGPGSTVGPSTSADAYSTSANDVRWNIRPGAILIATQDPIKASLSFFLPVSTVSAMSVTVESRSSTSGIRQKVEIKQGAGAGFTNLETFSPLPTGASPDRVVTLAVPLPNTHIDVGAGNKVVVNLLAKNTTAVLVFPWQYQVDVVYVDITP